MGINFHENHNEWVKKIKEMNKEELFNLLINSDSKPYEKAFMEARDILLSKLDCEKCERLKYIKTEITAKCDVIDAYIFDINIRAVSNAINEIREILKF